MNESEEMEKYNKEFNEKLSARKKTNLRTCPQCRGVGGFYSTVCWPEFSKCSKCFGKKYI
jgi:DnaJ-class molecular chaperone